MSCCDYGAFYEDEGILPPIHDCPAPVPIESDDLERPLTDLEHDLLGSLHLAFGKATGKITAMPSRRWL